MSASTGIEEGFDEEIDYQYNVFAWAIRKNSVDVCVENATKYTDEFRKQHGDSTQVVKYGEGPKQIMEITKPPSVKEDTPMMLFVHGGYWVETSTEMYSYTAQKPVENGWIGVNVGYDQAPQVSITTITNQIRDAYVHLSKQFPKCSGLTVVGHSAGGHLVSMLLATDWKSYCSEHNNLIPIRNCVPISGVLDVRPFMRISYNEQLKLTRTEVVELSPLLQIEKALPTIKKFCTKITAVAGEHDPPTFIQQSKDYVEALKRQSVDAEFIEMAGLDHFQLIEKFVEPDYKINKVIFGPSK